MDTIGRRYLTLALSLDRHFPGFVDAYFGPPELKDQVEAGDPRPLDALADDAQRLQEAIEAADCDPQRRDFLARQTGAIAAVIGNLAGDRLDFVREVERYFDITPEMVDESVFEAAHAELQDLLPGDGPLVERLAAQRKRLELAPDRILPVFDLARKEMRRRTLALFELPPGEEISLELVKGQPWGAYNWYLGGYRSRIEVNTDLPVEVDAAFPLVAHEAYPGHHTEHAIKEYKLYRVQGRWEHAVQLLLAPECVISEGIGDNALWIVFDDAQLVDFLRDELFPLAGLPEVDAGQQVRLLRALQKLRSVSGNAALLLHRDNLPPDEVQHYAERYGLRTPQETAQTMKFLQNPLFRSYIFNYAQGKALLAPLLQGPGGAANFRRLLQEPFTPTQVRQWRQQRQEAQGG
jgi:hypothetical protein